MKPKNVSKSTKRKQTIHKHNRRDIFLCRFRQRYFILVACYMNIMFVLLWLVANLILIRRYYQSWNFWNDTFIVTKIYAAAESFGNSKNYLKYSVYILDITNASSYNSVICRDTIVKSKYRQVLNTYYFISWNQCEKENRSINFPRKTLNVYVNAFRAISLF